MRDDPTSVTIYERVIDGAPEKEYEIRLTINEFRGVEYLHVRRYYMDFFGDWKPSNEGISMELGLSNIGELFAGLVEILSLAESKSILEQHFKETLDQLYQN